ncbi:hypothetical protein [Streptomyces sp. NPDC048508]|uniref:hypothetical protein n=1 Tax=Streptomyces sp. NPDC048508 TaxID=3365561 RepID=UPI003716D653
MPDPTPTTAPDPDPAPDPAPVPASRTRRDESASQAWAEALAKACTHPDHARRPRSELMAAALQAHRALTRGPGPGVPLTALGAHGDPRALAAFVAVYAAQQHPRERRTSGNAV